MKQIICRALFLTFLGSLTVAAPWPGLGQEEESSAPGLDEEQLLMIIRKSLANGSSRATVTSNVDLQRAPAHVRALVRTVRRTRLSLDVHQWSAKDALDFIRKATALNFVLSAKAHTALKEEKPTVSLDVENLPLEDILDLLALQLGEYRFTIRSSAIVLLHKEEYRPRKILRVYNVRRLMTPVRDFPAPALGASLRAPDE